METQYLKTLLMAVDEGSFSRAAIKLNVTQSAVSQRTKSLEACCGVPLLDRSGATLQPTVAGRVVIEGARRILAMEEQMMLELRSLSDKLHLHICCTPAFGMSHLPQVLKTFVSQYGEIDDLMFLFGTPLQALDGLRAGEFDVVVIEHLADLDLGALHHMTLPPDHMVFVSAPDSGIPAGEVALSVLHAFPFMSRRDGCGCRDLLSCNLASANSNIELFRRLVVLDDLSLIINEVLAGMGITFISRSVVATYIADGRLLEHQVPDFQCFCQRSIVARECETSSSLKRGFVESVQGHFNIEI